MTKSRELLNKSAEENSLTFILKRGVAGGSRKKFKGKRPPDKPKTRKELRKEQRKNKKSMKHEYILSKFGKSLTPKDDGKPKRKRNNRKRNRKAIGSKDNEQEGESDQESPGKYVRVRPVPEPGPPNKKSREESKEEESKKGLKTHLQKSEDDKELEQLRKEMEENRKQRLREENAEEDKVIRQMEKKLKLKKKSKIPSSFREDGLDYVLELCQSSSKKDKKMEKAGKISKDDDSDDEDSLDEDEEGSDDGSEDIEAEQDSDKESVICKEDDEMDSCSDQEDEEDVNSDSNNSNESNDEEGELKRSKEASKNKDKKKKGDDDGIWEDIYGRMRRKDGSVIDEKLNQGQQQEEETGKPSKEIAITGKYIPPMQRTNQTQRDKITRSLKGLLNRLSESNMHTIARQIEDLYMENSRNEINECMLDILYAVLLRDVIVPERVILEHVMLIAILHANIGTEIGAFFLQKFVQDFRERYDVKAPEDANKQLENLALLISSMYHFKVVDACLIYNILNLLASNFTPKDVELILAILRSVGFRLRKDDPVELKSLIVLIQQKATESKSNASSAKVKFMLEIVTAIRNNNMTKIPNYDPSVGDHLQKILKSHIHKGSYVSTMKIKMEDLLNAETKGRWWIVGSAWSNLDNEKRLDNNNPEANPASHSVNKQQNEKLLAKAKALGMNTETRKTIFCILMTAEDFVDAFNKLNHLELKNNQEREIIHVATYCCLHEKKFNPYYALVASKFCTADRKYMYPLWFKQEIAEYVEILGQRGTARLFSISQRQVFDWTKAKSSQEQTLLSLRSSKQLLDYDVEKQVYEWVQEQRPIQVSSTEIREKAKDFYRAKGHLSIKCSYGWYRRWCSRFGTKVDPHEESDNLILVWILQQYDQNVSVSYPQLQNYAQQQLTKYKPDFKASAGWVTRFFKRHYSFLNEDALCDKELPLPLETELEAFLKDTIETERSWSRDKIGCMDEIPLSLSQLNTSDQSRLRKCSLANCDASIILTLMADGTLLAPFVIIKAQNLSDLFQVYAQQDNSIFVYYCKATEPTLQCLEKWHEVIWAKNRGSSSSLLFLDHYDLHTEFKEKYSSSCFSIKIFPPGCSFKLQPLNHSTKGQFLKSMKDFWSDHLNKASEDIAVQLPSTDQIIKWVSESYEKLKEQKELLSYSFTKTKLIGKPDLQLE